ncbi:hypothetical protein C5167_020741 [Papaver somniferum]|uniref:Bifunctional inhibitor/plant lipid transfer protein/seed storage helical domain-containing protein n=1 Tax=Papaver somniferum TaxID=3469 RepID=A0A4Y7IX67_PAPSO|nr:uncharacterized protein LOC113354325 isoform X1 [Papaver somniferum]RZC52312.1 hypothetical protein C5167_020741 [Papaver somniferum]
MMKFFSSSLLLVLILMLTITSQTTVTVNHTSITTTTTTTFSPMCAAAESTTIVSSKEGCSNELTELAVCLPYISSPPNNLTDEVPSSCCDRYKSSYGTGYVTCLCHLVREPCLLGFPVDITRMFALSTVCHSAIPVDGISLEVLCEAILPNLRPLGSTLGSEPSASPSESNGSPAAATTILPANEAQTNSSLPADEAHTNSSTPFPTHTAHRSFGSKLLPELKPKNVVTYIGCYSIFVLWHAFA